MANLTIEEMVDKMEAIKNERIELGVWADRMNMKYPKNNAPVAVRQQGLTKLARLHELDKEYDSLHKEVFGITLTELVQNADKAKRGFN